MESINPVQKDLSVDDIESGQQSPSVSQRRLRRPTAADALGVHRLVADSGVLDLNSTYAYLLLSTDFADTSIVGERDGRVCGFVGGYHPPQRPDVLFVWQVVVAATERGTGLGGAMLDALVHRVRSERNGHPITVEATVAPSNASSRALFGGLARRHGVPMSEHERFVAAELDLNGDHEDEPVLRIGPIAAPLNDR